MAMLSKVKNKYIILGISFLPILIVIFAKMNNYYIGINLSESIDKTIFLYKEDPSYVPKKNDIAVFKVKNDDQFYPNKRFVKIIIATPDDKITQIGNHYVVNNIQITAKKYAKNGQKLDNFKILNNIIPKNNYFVITDHKDSYDSRYFGYVNQDQIIGYVTASI